MVPTGEAMDVPLLQKIALFTAVLVVDDAVDDGTLRILLSSRHLSSKASPIRRVRARFCDVTNQLTDSEFRLAFRMTRFTYIKLLNRFRSFLMRNEANSTRSSGGPIHPSVRLAITL